MKVINLSDKVDGYIKWYCSEVASPSNVEEYDKIATDMSNLIDKIASWFEFLWPDASFSNEDNKLANLQKYKKSFTLEEMKLLRPFSFTSMPGKWSQDISIEELAYMFRLLRTDVCDIDVAFELEEKQKRRTEAINKFLNAVIDRILMLGGPIYGPKRAILFCKIFEWNYGRAISYMIDTTNQDIVPLIEGLVNLGTGVDWPMVLNYYSSDKDEHTVVPFYEIERIYGEAPLGDPEAKKAYIQEQLNALEKSYRGDTRKLISHNNHSFDI